MDAGNCDRVGHVLSAVKTGSDDDIAELAGGCGFEFTVCFKLLDRETLRVFLQVDFLVGVRSVSLSWTVVSRRDGLRDLAMFRRNGCHTGSCRFTL